MNPPFSQGRAKAHVEHATGFLRNKGVLVTVCPSSMHSMEIAGFKVKNMGIYENMFDGTAISIVILKITKEEIV